jgi:hypothetical protein
MRSAPPPSEQLKALNALRFSGDEMGHDGALLGGIAVVSALTDLNVSMRAFSFSVALDRSKIHHSMITFAK